MLRVIFAALALAPLAYSAPLPKEQKTELYYPIQVGAKRVMELDGRETIETVEKVEAKDGKYRVSISTSTGKLLNVLEVSAQGVSRIQVMSKDLDKPFILIKLPAKEGDSWEFLDYTYTVGKEEEVEVPAGKFKAIPVSVQSSRDGVKIIHTSWYAPKVGMIKVASSANGSVERISVLKSFTPGK
jgi:hypothetical protein